MISSSWRGCLAVVPFTFVLACSTTNITNIIVANDGGAADGAEEDSAAQDGAVADEGGADAADASPEAGPPDLMSYWPLAVGYEWNYRNVTPSDCPFTTMSVTGTVVMGGKPGFAVTNTCLTAQSGSYAPTPAHAVDMFSTAVNGGAWVQVLPSGPNGTFISTPSVTVPAGTFTDCITNGQVGGQIFFTWCRGVGLVDWSVGSHGRLQLMSKSF